MEQPLKERLKESKCEMCKDALWEIIRLEAALISADKRTDRLLYRHSDRLRSKTSKTTAAGQALHQRRHA